MKTRIKPAGPGKPRTHGRTSRRLTALACAAALAAGSGPASAEVLVAYDFEGANGTPSLADARLTATNCAYVGDGEEAYLAGYNSTFAYRGTSWPTDGVPDEHFSFAVTLGAGFIADITNVVFAEQRSTEGPLNWVLRYSTDNATYYDLGAGDIGAAGSFHLQKAAGCCAPDMTGTVYFRLYATNATSASGTWRVDDLTVNGAIRVDDGTRILRQQGFDGAPSDNWGYAVTAGSATVAPSTTRSATGARSLRLTGSPDDSDPYVTFTNVPLGDVSDVRFSVAFSVQGPDAQDNLQLQLSYSNGAAWTDPGSTTLVYGYSQANVPFGGTSASNPATVNANPWPVILDSARTQLAVRVFFEERDDANNSSDYYYVDDVRLSGIPVPATNAPSISNYGGVTGQTANGATVRGHVRGGYPYPVVTVYWGPADGGTNSGDWSHAVTLGTQTWGLVEQALTGLTPGQVYYYRCHAQNVHGAAWADSAAQFSTLAGTLGTRSRVYIDSFGVGTNMPLSIDLDANGMADTWEREHFGPVPPAPDGDADGDGISNHREFLAGTDPNDTNSFMRIADMDLADPASADIRIWIAAGAHGEPAAYPGDSQGARRFLVRAADEDIAGVHRSIGYVTDTGTGTNLYTDTGATDTYAHRYYDVTVNYGGESYTNTERWAMHAQDRAPGGRYLVCVPIDYGSTNANNLGGTLGQHLARGLRAGTTTNDSDLARYRMPDGTWKEYYLFTNAAGVYWYDEDTGTNADLTVTPGAALWVRRGSGSAPRDNTVFTGRSFAGSDMVDMTFTTNYGGWTLFGWPLPQTRGHRRADSSTNQLGFYARGIGGRTSDPKRAGELGDQIWVWQDNTWKHFYWMIDGLGPPWDGRWWDDHARDFADFTLEPGRAYYYRHSQNNGGTNFTWRPEAP